MTDNTPPTQTEPQPKGVAATFREAFQRARESRPNRPSRRKPAEELGESERSARNRDLANRLLSTLRESSGLCDLDFDNDGDVELRYGSITVYVGLHRNLQQRVTFLYLEFEDLFVILGLAALTRETG